MPRRLLIALLLLVAAPLALLGWFSASAYRQQQFDARQRLTMLFTARLGEIDRTLENVFVGYERRLLEAIDSSDDPLETLRRLDRREPIVRTTIFVDKQGVMVHPAAPWPEDSENVALHASLPAIIASRPELSGSDEDESGEWTRGAQQSKGGNSQQSNNPAQQRNDPAQQVSRRSFGAGKWQTWYMEQGLQLIHWLPRSDGAAVGVMLQRARWVSDLTAALPDTPLDVNRPGGAVASLKPTSLAGFTTLQDESGQLVYRWGEPRTPDSQMLAALPLSSPLGSWQLQYYSVDPLPASAATAMIASLAALGVLLLSLGGYVLSGVQREMRSARQRVSFASQVSHELRTPLTNIRLYTELAESDLDQLDESETRRTLTRRLHVIETETRRLSRLVSGVLELIRDPRKSKGLRLQERIPDEVIDQTLMQFAPSFANTGLELQRDAGATKAVPLDADLLELILVNLISNVEKYASGGGRLYVRSTIIGGQLVVHVCDWGTGIPRRHRRQIFQAFWRLDDSISAPAGTGIGLTIARRLAQRHGGDLRLLDAPPAAMATGDQPCGACFELRLCVNESVCSPKATRQ